MKKNENVKTEENEVQETETIETEEVVVAEKESWVKKALKIAAASLAMIATGVVGYFLGRNSNDENSEETTESEAA